MTEMWLAATCGELLLTQALLMASVGGFIEDPLSDATGPFFCHFNY